MQEKKTNEDVWEDLKRRVSITRKARIKASKRLRKKHDFFEKVTNFYSLLVLILSVWFMNIPDQEQSILVTKILLILSLSLTFFTMFLNTKNYKERAGSFETNYQNLDILLNRMERLEVNQENINTDIIKQLQREYEKLIIDKENHQDIDFMSSSDKLEEKFDREIRKYKRRNLYIYVVVSLYPIILLVAIYLINTLLKYI